MRFLLENPLKFFLEQQTAQGKRQASEMQEVHSVILEFKADRGISCMYVTGYLDHHILVIWVHYLPIRGQHIILPVGRLSIIRNIEKHYKKQK